MKILMVYVLQKMSKVENSIGRVGVLRKYFPDIIIAGLLRGLYMLPDFGLID